MPEESHAARAALDLLDCDRSDYTNDSVATSGSFVTETLRADLAFRLAGGTLTVNHGYTDLSSIS